MKHYGDITKISGYDAEPVDVIFGGSPCQDLSVAGKRAGLSGERSGLFMEQIRVTKELRDADKDRGRTDQFIRPRYFVWENVVGAFSSAGGKDFQAVIEEVIGIVADGVHVPMPSSAKWLRAGLLVDGDGRWSVAWRTHDAQYWGTTVWPTPQRRRRISLVADFAGLTAGERLFEPQGLRGDSAPERGTGKGTPGGAERGSYGADRDLQGRRAATLQIRGGVPIDSNGKQAGKGALIQYEKCAALTAANDKTLFEPTYCIDHAITTQGSTAQGKCVYEEISGTLKASAPHSVCEPTYIEYHPQDSRVRIGGDVCQTIASNAGTGGNNLPIVVEPQAIHEADGQDVTMQDVVAYALTTNGGKPGQGYPCIMEPQGVDLYNGAITGDVSRTINSAATDATHIPCCDMGAK